MSFDFICRLLTIKNLFDGCRFAGIETAADEVRSTISVYADEKKSIDLPDGLGETPQLGSTAAEQVLVLLQWLTLFHSMAVKKRPHRPDLLTTFVDKDGKEMTEEAGLDAMIAGCWRWVS
jgi:hypothetical protein